MRTACAILTLLLTCSCNGKPPQKASPAHPTKATQPTDDPDTDPTAKVAPSGPPLLQISRLSPSATKEVRIRGTISKVIGVRMVPPRTIFELRDASGTATLVIKERKQSLTEGTKMEAVGNYMEAPDPMYTGPGEAPKKVIFVVDRYIDMPNI